jgi:hypothetical protein
MIFIILISLALEGLMQTVNHYQALSTEFKLNATISAMEPQLMRDALKSTTEYNAHAEILTPDPHSMPMQDYLENQIYLRAILQQKNQTVYIWQGWFFLHDPGLPLAPLYEARIRCLKNSTQCDLIAWHRVFDS